MITSFSPRAIEEFIFLDKYINKLFLSVPKMVQASTIKKINELQKAGAPADYIKTVTNIMESKTSKSSSSTASSSKNTNSNLNNPTNVQTKKTEPSFFSKEGQKQAFKRVYDVFTLKPSAIVNPFTDQAYSSQTMANIVRGATVVSGIGSLAYGGALLAGSAGATAGATTAKATGSLFGAKTTLTALGAGAIAGGLLFGGSKQTQAPQTTTQTPTQNTTTTQDTYSYQIDNSIKNTDQSQKFIIKGSPNSSIYGSQTATPTGQTQSITPTQTVTPTQTTTAEQGQIQSSGSNILTIAVVALATYALTR